MYLPYLQEKSYLEGPGVHHQYLTLVVRSAIDPAAVASAVRREVRALAPDVAVAQVATMEAVVASATARPRFYLVLFGGFAAIALTLAAVGIYGVMSYSVSRRTREIGVRMALGAQRGQVLWMVVGQGAALAAAGAVVGLTGALLLSRVMAGLLFGVAPTDAVTLGVVTVVLCAVAVVASWIPARRAARIDPMIALRGD
jgi:ABC-type antimicrobial peptide transport system permease subunit